MVIYTIIIVIGGITMSSVNKATKNPENGPLCDAHILSVEECRKYLAKFNISDDEIVKIRDYLVGIIDKSINLYLDDFK